jgi:GNAT superfamily N-acetyltransferase
MAKLVPAEKGPLLDAILEATYQSWNDGLTPTAYARYYGAQLKTPWGRDHLRRVALVDGDHILASAKIYTLDAMLDGAPVRVAGLGAVFTQPAHRGRGAARDLIDRIIAREAAAGADIALLFSEIGADYYARLGFEVVPTTRRELRIARPERHGAPMTMVRQGEERDFADIALMERTRASGYRFHLNRDRDLIHFSVARTRLLAGLGPAGVREVQFFIAEEGASAVAYVLISAQGRRRGANGRSKRPAIAIRPARAPARFCRSCSRAIPPSVVPRSQAGCPTVSCRRRSRLSTSKLPRRS